MKGYRNQRGEISLSPQDSTESTETVELSGRGVVYSCTTLHASAEPFQAELPFQIAIVSLEGGPRLTARIDGERVKIGDTVQQVSERNGVWIFSRASS